MIQIVLLITSVAFVILGVKGFTSSGLALSKTKTITGMQAKIIGALCILFGIGLIPLLFLLIWLFTGR